MAVLPGPSAHTAAPVTDAVPAGVTIYMDTRRRTLQVGKLAIQFKVAPPSRMYWADRPAMRVVQTQSWQRSYTLRYVSTRISSNFPVSLDIQRHAAGDADSLITHPWLSSAGGR